MSTEETKFLKSINLKNWGVIVMLIATFAVNFHQVRSNNERLAKHDELLRIPRYTLEDDERREQALRREIALQFGRVDGELKDRRDWMLETTETLVVLREQNAQMNQMLKEISKKVNP